jgi:hypothetical protein
MEEIIIEGYDFEDDRFFKVYKLRRRKIVLIQNGLKGVIHGSVCNTLVNLFTLK